MIYPNSMFASAQEHEAAIVDLQKDIRKYKVKERRRRLLEAEHIIALSRQPDATTAIASYLEALYAERMEEHGPCYSW